MNRSSSCTACGRSSAGVLRPRVREDPVRGAFPLVVEYGGGVDRPLKDIETPLAMPSIMTGVNQTILMCLSMVVIASGMTPDTFIAERQP